MLACVYVAANLYAMTGYKSIVWMNLLILSGIAIKEWRFGKWKSGILWMAFLLCAFDIAVVQYGRETAFRSAYMDQLTNESQRKICGQLYKKEYKNESYRYYLKNCSIQLSKEVLPCNRILSYVEADTYQIGDTLVINGKVKMFDTAANEGQFDARAFYQSQKIDFAIYDGAVVTCKPTAIHLWEGLYQIRQKLVWVIEYHLKEEPAGILASILYGEKGLMLEDVKKLYQASGISHILAISGLHVSLVGMMLYRILRKRGISFWQSAIWAGIWICLYGSMTGNAVSTQRAIGMMLLSMGAQILGRTNDLLNSLGLVVLVLLIENPFLLGYAGFVFSVVAVCGVGITGVIFAEEEEKEGQADGSNKNKIIKTKINKIITSWKSGIWMSIGIWLTTLPLVAWYYYEIPMYGVLLNMVVLPLLNVIFISGIFGSVIGLHIGWLAGWGFQPAAILLDVYSKLCRFTAKLPAANVIVGKPSPQRILIYYIILGMMLGMIHCLRQKNKKVQLAGKVLASLLLVGVLLTPKSQEGGEIDFLDVGQGDGIYILAPDGIDIFIDGGSSSVKEAGTYRILPFLKSKGVAQIDYWFVSHGDEDHINGLLEAMESGYHINNLVVSRYMIRDEAYDRLLDDAKRYGIPVIRMKKGDAVVSTDFRMECLYPGENESDDKNDMSLTIKLTMEQYTGIFAGDISAAAEQIIAEEALVEGVDIYKVNHHGSRYSSSEEFLRVLHPEISVISCAKKNRYGHPADEAVQRIEEEGSKVFYTMKGGRICMRVRKAGIEVSEFAVQK